MMSDSYFVELGKNPVRFDPVGEVTNVFFDESNKQVSGFASHCVALFVIISLQLQSVLMQFQDLEVGNLSPCISLLLCSAV